MSAAPRMPTTADARSGDPEGAFVERRTIEPTAEGSLSGLDFAIKDLFDVAGRVTGAGAPEWSETHRAAEVHAPALGVLLAAGGRCVGVTHTDELAYSLMGVNARYGAPRNPAAPDRVPGGSSSGSVSAVAAGRVDFALGTDTGGSIRLPAAFCGVYGLRTTHAAISTDGVVPLAPSFDTIGWFARDPQILDRVAAVYRFAPSAAPPARLIAPSDLWALAEPATVAALAPSLRALEILFGAADHGPLALGPEKLSQWRETFRVLQGFEAWRAHGAWIRARRPAFGPGVRERFEAAEAIAAEQYEAARRDRDRIVARIEARLGDDAVAVFPTGPAPAPRLDAGEGALDGFRARALEALCPAGLSGRPQLSIPAARVDGAPVGLSLLGPRGADRRLIACARVLLGRR